MKKKYPDNIDHQISEQNKIEKIQNSQLTNINDYINNLRKTVTSELLPAFDMLVLLHSKTDNYNRNASADRY